MNLKSKCLATLDEWFIIFCRVHFRSYKDNSNSAIEIFFSFEFLHKISSTRYRKGFEFCKMVFSFILLAKLGLEKVNLNEGV